MAVILKDDDGRNFSLLATMKMVQTGQQFDLSALQGSRWTNTRQVGASRLDPAPLAALAPLLHDGRGLGHSGTIDKLESIKALKLKL